MFIVMNAQFRADQDEYNLVCTCEECGNFVPETEACSIEYPTAPHRQATFDALKDGERMFFCKMFEAR